MNSGRRMLEQDRERRPGSQSKRRIEVECSWPSIVTPRGPGYTQSFYSEITDVKLTALLSVGCHYDLIKEFSKEDW